MGGDRAASATAQVRRTAAQDRSAGGDGCHSRHRIRRLPMADAAQGFSAAVHGAGLLLQVARQPSLGNDQPPPGPERAGAGRARRQSHGRRDRQPECEDDRERRPVGLRRGEEGQGPQAPHRYRHTIVTDTLGLMLFVLVHGADGADGADVQDHDGAPALLKAIRHRFPWLRHIFADGGYAGDKLRAALQGHGVWTLEIVKRSDTAKGFELLPRRWVVERTFAWLGRCRRLAKDWETTIESSTAWAFIASIRLMSRRLARYCYPT